MNSRPTKWSEITTDCIATRDKSVSIFVATAVRTSDLVNMVLFLSHILKVTNQTICTINFFKHMPVHLHHQLLQINASPFAPSTVANLSQSVWAINFCKLIPVQLHHHLLEIMPVHMLCQLMPHIPVYLHH